MSEPGVVARGCGLLLAALLSGCVSVPQRGAPVLQQAARHNQQGLRAEGQNSFAAAVAEFAEAYRLYSSVENYPGMVTALVNSSRLYRAARQLPQAEQATERALALAGQTPELAAEVWFEKAKLLLLQNNSEAAALWGEKALTAAAESEQPRMGNLLADIYRRQGVRSRAGLYAEKALQQSRTVRDRREEANALRMLGELEFIEQRFAAAVGRFAAALAIDKELALPRKISADLRALAQSHAAMGDTAAAAGYLQRAVAAALADGDRQQAVVDLEKLGQLQERSGQLEAAAKTEELRQKLQQEQE